MKLAPGCEGELVELGAGAGRRFCGGGDMGPFGSGVMAYTCLLACCGVLDSFGDCMLPEYRIKVGSKEDKKFC